MTTAKPKARPVVRRTQAKVPTPVTTSAAKDEFEYTPVYNELVATHPDPTYTLSWPELDDAHTKEASAPA